MADGKHTMAQGIGNVVLRHSAACRRKQDYSHQSLVLEDQLLSVDNSSLEVRNVGRPAVIGGQQ